MSDAFDVLFDLPTMLRSPFLTWLLIGVALLLTCLEVQVLPTGT